jgi:hypothetical protein
LSILHVNQIAGALHRMFDGVIVLDDAQTDPAERERLFLSRALAAFALTQLAGIAPVDAAAALTDGTGDNGIDAIYFDVPSKTLYVVQSKWRVDGNGSFDRADIMKFSKGFEDLANQDLSRFNDKVRAMESVINDAFFDEQAHYVMVAIHTGSHDLAKEPRTDLDDCLERFNDTADDEADDLLEARVLKQSDVYNLVAKGLQGKPINLEVTLFHWGEATDPYAVYGQVAADQVAAWWKEYYPQIVSQNLRHFLGTDTEVNAGLQHTLLTEPEHFWHYNNGITAICKDVKPKGIGGKAKEAGIFVCTDVRVVNGAQTAGSIAASAERKGVALEKARVQIRFIALAEADALADSITRATNTQNRVNRQDFVALDPEQQRLRLELGVDGISYNFKSGAGTRDSKSFDLEEATIALACASSEVSYSTLAKREISRLWEDPKKAPYKALFNPGLQANKLWRSVQVLRLIDRALALHRSKLSGRDKGLVVHGNRFIAHIAFQRLPNDLLDPSKQLPQDAAKVAADIVAAVIPDLQAKANALYPQTYPATLFKNQQKLAKLAKEILAKGGRDRS